MTSIFVKLSSSRANDLPQHRVAMPSFFLHRCARETLGEAGEEFRRYRLCQRRLNAPEL